MMRWGMRIVALITGLCILLALAFTAIELVAFDKDRYVKAYAEGGTAEYIGISEEDLLTVTDRLLDYLALKEDSLDMQMVIRGELQTVFEERESLHMVDVRNIFAAGFALRRWTVILAAAGVITLFAVLKKKAFRLLAQGYLWAMALFAAFAIVLGIAMAVDFNRAFILFHHLLFTNDLWLLNPMTDVLIQMFPEVFFSDMATAILVWACIAVAAPAVISAVYLICQRRRERSHEL